MYNMDKLYEAVAAKGHVCVGLDTAASYIPPKARASLSDAEAVLAYNKAIIDATADAAACFKVQIAYYEEMGVAGLDCYAKTLAYARARGALTIADIKRGDIADTAERYARAHFSGDFEADFVTLTPYLGMDSIEPWLNWAEKKGKGAFVLMRTSNKGRRDFEYLEINEGGSPPLAPASLREPKTCAGSAEARSKSSATPPAGPLGAESVAAAEEFFRATPFCANRKMPSPVRAPLSGAPAAPPSPRRLYHVVGEKLSALAAAAQGRYGYGAFGAVAGCTEPEETAELRTMFPNLFFLIPGYGAQGGAANDAALLLREGNGGVVNASRSILKAWSAAASSAGISEDKADLTFAAEVAKKAALEMRDAIRAAAKNGANK